MAHRCKKPWFCEVKFFRATSRFIGMRFGLFEISNECIFFSACNKLFARRVSNPVTEIEKETCEQKGQRDALWWNGANILTGASGTTIGTGLANTNLIISKQGAGTYAASICKNLTTGGYTDWYLPSINELNKLYINRLIIGGFTDNFYWSSSEYDSTMVQIEDFTDGSFGECGKNSFINHLRAVRSF